MDFFVDSGVVIGYSYIEDKKFHAPCKQFALRYPFRNNGYYSLVYLIKEEIRDTERLRTILGKKSSIKLFTQRAKIFCDSIKDVSNTTHSAFHQLFEKIHTFLLKVRTDKRRKEHDARFLASAFIWESENQLMTPHFITTDWGDICKNKTSLTTIANNQLSRSSQLIIKFIIDMVT